LPSTCRSAPRKTVFPPFAPTPVPEQGGFWLPKCSACQKNIRSISACSSIQGLPSLENPIQKNGRKRVAGRPIGSKRGTGAEVCIFMSSLHRRPRQFTRRQNPNVPLGAVQEHRIAVEVRGQHRDAGLAPPTIPAFPQCPAPVGRPYNGELQCVRDSSIARRRPERSWSRNVLRQLFNVCGVRPASTGCPSNTIHLFQGWHRRTS